MYNSYAGPVAQWIEQFRPKEKVASSTLARITKTNPSVHPRVLFCYPTDVELKSKLATYSFGIYAA